MARPFGPAERGQARRPAVAGVALRAGPGQMVDGRAVRARYGGSRCPRAAPGRSCRPRRPPPRAVHRAVSPEQRRAIRRRPALAGAADRRDDAGVEIDGAQPMVADVADQQPPVRRDRHAVRLAQGGARGRAAVAREPGSAGAGHASRVRPSARRPAGRRGCRAPRCRGVRAHRRRSRAACSARRSWPARRHRA